MPLRPPIIRRPQPAQDRKDPETPVLRPSVGDSEPPRLTRPVPSRTDPIRTVGGLFREEGKGGRSDGSAPMAKPQGAQSGTPAEQCLAEAYRVFDEYIEEGRRYGRGQSAWYNDGARQRPSFASALHGGNEALNLIVDFASQLTQALGGAWPLPIPSVLGDSMRRHRAAPPSWHDSRTQAPPSNEEDGWEDVNLGAAPAARSSPPDSAAHASSAESQPMAAASDAGAPRGARASVPGLKERWKVRPAKTSL
jgi:hypothetical protein